MTWGGWATWRWPLAIGIVTLCGLLAALFAGGAIGMIAGWVGVGCPTLLLFARATIRRTRD